MKFRAISNGKAAVNLSSTLQKRAKKKRKEKNLSIVLLCFFLGIAVFSGSAFYLC
jgi:uncharacterized membrane protein YgdD (TMEM256/DUF423 family)